MKKGLRRSPTTHRYFIPCCQHHTYTHTLSVASSLRAQSVIFAGSTIDLPEPTKRKISCHFADLRLPHLRVIKVKATAKVENRQPGQLKVPVLIPAWG